MNACIRYILIILLTFVVLLFGSETAQAATENGSIAVSAVVPETPELRAGLAANSTVDVPFGIILGEPIPVKVLIRSLAGNPRAHHELELTIVDEWGRVVDRTFSLTGRNGRAIASLIPRFAGRYRVEVRDVDAAVVLADHPTIIVSDLKSHREDQGRSGDQKFVAVDLSTTTSISLGVILESAQRGSGDPCIGIDTQCRSTNWRSIWLENDT